MKDSGGGLGETGVTAPRIAVAALPLPHTTSTPSPPEGLDWPGAATAGKPRVMPSAAGYGDDKKTWNTRRIAARVLVDVAAAASAAVLITPVITTIDRGIIENASGRASLKDSIVKSLRTLILRPHKFIFSKPFALIFTVYGSTYLAANTIDTVSSTVKNKPASSVTHGTAKFAATSATNLSVGIWKDSHFTKLFSTAAPRSMPPPTIALFALRDSLTIFASFNVPPLLAPHIPTYMLPEFMRGINKQSMAQFLAPAAIQVASTPFHLLGLDLYNRHKVTLAERWDLVRGMWVPSFLARICRIVPAFGVGGVVNTSMRHRFMKKLE